MVGVLGTNNQTEEGQDGLRNTTVCQQSIQHWYMVPITSSNLSHWQTSHVTSQNLDLSLTNHSPNIPVYTSTQKQHNSYWLNSTSYKNTQTQRHAPSPHSRLAEIVATLQQNTQTFTSAIEVVFFFGCLLVCLSERLLKKLRVWILKKFLESTRNRRSESGGDLKPAVVESV